MLALGLSLLLGAALAEEAAPLPRIEAVEIEGASVFPRDQVLRIVRLEPGDPLRRGPEEVAQTLETRYHDMGYPAASVLGSFDATSGTLRLRVDEGRLAAVEVRGTSPAGAERALAASGLGPGRLLRQDDVWDAFDRIEERSDGAFAPGDFSLESDGAGPRLVLEPKERRARLTPRFGGPRTSGRYNRVDGVLPYLGADLTLYDHGSWNHTTLNGFAGYGFSSKKLRWALGIVRPFFTERRFSLGYEYHAITDSDDLWRSVGLEEADGTAVFIHNFERGSYRDFFARRGHEAYAFLRMDDGGRAQLGLSYRRDDYRSLPVTTSSKDENPEIDDGRLGSLIGTLRFSSSGPLFESWSRERHSFLQRSLYGLYRRPPRAFRAEATYELASKGLGSDFAFRRFIANLRLHEPLAPGHAVDVRLLFGIGRDLPAQKLFSLGGIGSLRGYEAKAFPGENIVLGSAEYSFAPGGQWPRLIAFSDVGAAWTEGVSGEGVKADAGLGVKWPPDARGFMLRLDAARPIFDPELKRTRVIFRIQLPF